MISIVNLAWFDMLVSAILLGNGVVISIALYRRRSSSRD
jgi:hypothetical protein